MALADDIARMAPPSDDNGAAVRARADLLRRKGFQQTQVIEPGTDRPALMWSRVWAGIRDTVIASRDGAVAYRVRESGFDRAKPFTVPPEATVWKSHPDHFLIVSAQLLDELAAAPGHLSTTRTLAAAVAESVESHACLTTG